MLLLLLYEQSGWNEVRRLTDRQADSALVFSSSFLSVSFFLNFILRSLARSIRFTEEAEPQIGKPISFFFLSIAAVHQKIDSFHLFGRLQKKCIVKFINLKKKKNFFLGVISPKTKNIYACIFFFLKDNRLCIEPVFNCKKHARR